MSEYLLPSFMKKRVKALEQLHLKYTLEALVEGMMLSFFPLIAATDWVATDIPLASTRAAPAIMLAMATEIGEQGEG